MSVLIIVSVGAVDSKSNVLSPFALRAAWDRPVAALTVGCDWSAVLPTESLFAFAIESMASSSDSVILVVLTSLSLMMVSWMIVVSTRCNSGCLASRIAKRFSAAQLPSSVAITIMARSFFIGVYMSLCLFPDATME